MWNAATLDEVIEMFEQQTLTKKRAAVDAIRDEEDEDA